MQVIFNLATLNGVEVVSARELHSFLEVGADFTNWCKRMFEYGFTADLDYTEVLAKNGENPKGGRPSTDYALTIRTAKEISMLQRSEKGKQARQYFLDIEEAHNKPMSQTEIILRSAQELLRIEKVQVEQERRISTLESRLITSPDYFTIVGYSTIEKMQVTRPLAVILGKKASLICKERNIPTDKTQDPRFGYVKLYPREVLQEVFNDYRNKLTPRATALTPKI